MQCLRENTRLIISGLPQSMLHGIEPNCAACFPKKTSSMSIRRILLVVAVVGLGLTSCRSGNDYFLRNGYTEIEDHAEVRRIRGERIPGSDLYDAARIAVYDSLCIFIPGRYPTGFMPFSTCIPEKISGYFVPRAAVRSNLRVWRRFMTCAAETEPCGPRSSTHTVSGCWSGMSPSRCCRELPFTIRYYLWRKEFCPSGLPGPVRIVIFSAALRCRSRISGEVVVPRYTLTSLPDLSDIRKYEVFTDSILSITSSGKWLMPDFVSMDYGMKPDGSKVVMAMSYSPQINVLDLASGSLACYRLKGLPRESTSRRIWYYASVCCDDNYIYALYNALDLQMSRSLKTGKA